jgi:hypothetical protein
MCGRAPLGGPREIALACFVVGRLVVDAASDSAVLDSEQKRTRAQGTKHWLSSASIPAPIRAALNRLAESTASDEKGVIKAALDSVMTVTASNLDSGARLELGRLAQAIAE